MAVDRAPLLLRPIHGWFFFWERVIPSLYRVVAVVVAMVISAALLVLAGLPWWVAVPIGAALWVGLAVVQEHDERVPRPVDEVFVRAVRERVEPVLVAAGFTFNSASGGQRARRDTADVVLYEAEPGRHPSLGEGDSPCLDLWIRRDARAGTMEVSVGWHDLEALIEGDRELAARVMRAVDAIDDAEVLARALALVFGQR
ncbi:MAG TPA: hypothetical protein VM287_00440 [Egibacteraceae bacterium]|nr:hypothetical protein [Egibacteraceae bacterium]